MQKSLKYLQGIVQKFLNYLEATLQKSLKCTFKSHCHTWNPVDVQKSLAIPGILRTCRNPWQYLDPVDVQKSLAKPGILWTCRNLWQYLESCGRAEILGNTWNPVDVQKSMVSPGILWTCRSPGSRDSSCLGAAGRRQGTLPATPPRSTLSTRSSPHKQI